MLDLISTNIIVREDFYEKFYSPTGVTLYVAAVFIVGYLCWEWKKWL
jgi:hypothetical protein